MKNALVITVAAISLSTLTVTDAHAWQRNGSITGEHGYSRSVSGYGNCAGGSCNRSLQVTGPAGYSRSSQGKIAKNPAGGWMHENTVTRRNGNAVAYEGSGSCFNGNCSYSGSRTGPNGTTTHSGSHSWY